MSRLEFYKKIKVSLFPTLTQKQVNGIEAILDEWERRGFTDLRRLAYTLGTVYHETAKTMNPVKEYGGEAYLRSKSYYPVC